MDKQQDDDITALERMNALLMPGSTLIDASKIGEPFPSVAACLLKFVQDSEQLPRKNNE